MDPAGLFGDSDSDTETAQQKQEPDIEVDLFGGESTSDQEEQEEQEQQNTLHPQYEEDAAEVGQQEQGREPVFKLITNHVSTTPSDLLYLIKMPHFLGISSNVWMGVEDEKDVENSNSSQGLGVEKVVRWRYKPSAMAGGILAGLQNGAIDAESVPKESNTRLIRWSNNTFSLIIGNEMFAVSTSSVSNQALYQPHPTEGIFTSSHIPTQSLTFTPNDLHSLTHKKLVHSIAKKHTKQARTKQMDSFVNPETQQREAIRLENEKIKARRKLEHLQRLKERDEDEGGVHEEEDESEDGYDRRRAHTAFSDEDAAMEENDGFVVRDVDSDEQDERDARLASSKRSGDDYYSKPAKTSTGAGKRLKIEESDEEDEY